MYTCRKKRKKNLMNKLSLNIGGRKFSLPVEYDVLDDEKSLYSRKKP